ncbi:MAG: hypothetical protein LUG44_10615 [Clostridiales bacterium]|nr:hypothetical protein [Clostridiales bacterium]
MKRTYRRKNVIVRCGADMFLPLGCVFGCYVIFHGNTSPGGGFQGGVLVASAILMVYLGHGGSGVKDSFRATLLHSSETVAEIMYVLIALLGVFTGLNFCMNFVFAGHQWETSILMNDVVGYHVMAGIICLLIAMLNTLNEDDVRKDENRQLRSESEEEVEEE